MIPVYFLSKWILKEWNLRNNENRKYLAIILAKIFNPIIYTLLIYLWFFSILHYLNN